MIMAGAGDDVITTSGNTTNYIAGGEGNDTMTLNGAHDNVVFGGNAADYTMTHVGNTYTITDNNHTAGHINEGTDTISGAEGFTFHDGSFDVNATTGNLTANNHSSAISFADIFGDGQQHNDALSNLGGELSKNVSSMTVSDGSCAVHMGADGLLPIVDTDTINQNLH